MPWLLLLPFSGCDGGPYHLAMRLKALAVFGGALSDGEGYRFACVLDVEIDTVNLSNRLFYE